TIPRGVVRSYAWVAKKIGPPQAVRAEANACCANPFAPLVPCHRVIRSDGTLGGFSGGTHLKKKLLQQEGVTVHPLP
ncbi:MAG: MGMT family protein, partial [Deltaproteobacteria bacterium]|nr:MGMT family protein [Deltaproteobacteria bacterium]